MKREITHPAVFYANCDITKGLSMLFLCDRVIEKWQLRGHGCHAGSFLGAFSLVSSIV